MPYLRQMSFTGMPASASFKIATIWLSVMRLLIVKLLCFSLKEILRVSCIILRGSYKNFLPSWIGEHMLKFCFDDCSLLFKRERCKIFLLDEKPTDTLSR